MLIATVGWIAIVWSVLIIANNALITPAGPWLPTVASALLFAVYGAVLVKRDRRAIMFTWLVVALFGVAVLLGGLVPIQLIVWTALVGFGWYLRKNRAALNAQ